MNSLMLDLETFGTIPGSVIRSIGAVAFDTHSDQLGVEFYANIEHESCLGFGLTVDAKTEAWWADQGPEAQAALLIDPKPLRQVVIAFDIWFAAFGQPLVWSQGANFDEPLWAAAIRSVGMTPPWKFWNARDTRTAYDMAELDYKAIKHSGTAHNALDDAKHQVQLVQMAYTKISK